MNINKIFSPEPQCPLCLNKMRAAYEPQRGLLVYVCDKDRIAIRQSDPCVGKWVPKEPVPCPNCGEPMRLFFTSTGYRKAICVKKGCKMQVVQDEPDALEDKRKKLDDIELKNAKGSAVKRSAKLDAAKLEDKLKGKETEGNA